MKRETDQLQKLIKRKHDYLNKLNSKEPKNSKSIDILNAEINILNNFYSAAENEITETRETLQAEIKSLNKENNELKNTVHKLISICGLHGIQNLRLYLSFSKDWLFNELLYCRENKYIQVPELLKNILNVFN